MTASIQREQSPNVGDAHILKEEEEEEPASTQCAVRRGIGRLQIHTAQIRASRRKSWSAVSDWSVAERSKGLEAEKRP